MRVFADEGPPMAALLKALRKQPAGRRLRPPAAGGDDAGRSTARPIRRRWSSR